MDLKHENANSHCTQCDKGCNDQVCLIGQQEVRVVGAITSYIWHENLGLSYHNTGKGLILILALASIALLATAKFF